MAGTSPAAEAVWNKPRALTKLMSPISPDM